VFKKNTLSESEVYELCGSDGRPLLMLLEVVSVIELTTASSVVVCVEVKRVTAQESV